MPTAGVYPRVGGGTPTPIFREPVRRGLSPRGRGNLPILPAHVPAHGSIPAWAGEPVGLRRPVFRQRVYPRVGGGTVECMGHLGLGGGLSPRGRGNLRAGSPALLPAGSIPAWAGEPHCLHLLRVHRSVYPRVGGGTVEGLVHLGLGGGLSPRGRGNQPLFPCGSNGRRSIPAWAGEPGRGMPGPEDGRVYPRVGGGTRPRQRVNFLSWGLSPRGRGNRQRAVRLTADMGSIPAWAGEPSRVKGISHGSAVYPRVGGGTFTGSISGVSGRGLSPRGRGNRGIGFLQVWMVGSIPAWAGEPATV